MTSTTNLFVKKDSMRGFTNEEALAKADIVAEAFKVQTAHSPWDFPEIIPDPRGCLGYAVKIQMRRR